MRLGSNFLDALSALDLLPLEWRVNQGSRIKRYDGRTEPCRILIRNETSKEPSHQ
jgi:hypothetical protein